MAKQLLYTDAARKKLLTGAEKLARAVGITLGPTGRNVIIDKSFGGPTVTKDGVTVAKEIELSDPFENMGAKLVNAVAQKTSDTAGDGTTTATVLALAIYAEGLRNITAGANPMGVKKGIDKAVSAAVAYIEGTLKRSITKKEEMANVASISANNDPKIGAMMADAFEKVGKDGVITVEESKTGETTLEFVDGMQFDKGYISPYFAAGSADLTWNAESPYVLIFEKKLANVREVLPLLEKIVATRKPLLIIAEDVESEALAMLVVNKLRGMIDVCAVKSPGFGDRRKAMLGDIATLTGGTFVSEDLGIKLESVELEHLGTADKVTVEKEKTTIICEKLDKDRHGAGPRAADPHADGADRVELRQGEVLRASREARRRRGDRARRRGDRGRDEADEGPRRGRAARHPRRGRRGRRARRRHRTLALRRGRQDPGRHPQGRRADRGAHRGPRDPEAAATRTIATPPTSFARRSENFSLS